MDSQASVVMMASVRRLLVLLPLLAIAGCPRSDRPDAAVRAFLSPEADPRSSAEGRFFEREGEGVLRYLGFDVDPERPEAGEALTLEHVFEIETPFRTNPMMFVHLDGPDGRRIAVGDHAVVGGEVALSAMKAGERWRDRHRLTLPADAPSGTSRLFVGLFSGEARMTLETTPGRNDGRDRLFAGTLALRGSAPPSLPEVTVPRIEGASIEPDGQLDEAAWARAPVLTFSDTLGRDRPTRFPTRLRLLYDDENLYVGFEAEDRDITERYSKRDDPIYEHETVELFLMPGVAAPELGPYVELQASPTGVIFDASFQSRRRGMRTDFDAAQRVGTTRDGTLNDPSPDRGWVSEWVVPFESLAGVERAPAPGDVWRMNAFRIEKYDENGELQGEYTAWSPPRVGDFHAVDRFGQLRFGGAEGPTP